MRRRAAALLLLLLPAPLSAVPQAAESARRRVDASYSRQTAYVSPDPLVDRLQDLFAPTLEANRKRFRARLGPVSGFGAGTLYPQIWLRDSATILPLSRYLYSREHLTSWLEEHLAHQKPSGELYDWIAAGAAANFTEWAPRAADVFRSGAVVVSADKNTVEADQEASAVLAVSQVFAITGDGAWLRKPIAGRTILERADLALSYLLRERFDERLGLVTSGFSADWGDVAPIHPDQRAIYLDAPTPLVVGLYTNALVHGAARELAGLHRAVGTTARAAYWEDRAARIRASLVAQLWQEGRGFFRMHRLIAASTDPRWDDSDIFAMGGNSVAALLGVADDRQAARIFDVAEMRRREHRVSTIAGTLLPPFPKGFFKHPVMVEPWSYQNGGQWDWFAGRLVLAEFERGHAARAFSHLRELAAKAARCNGLYEWHTRSGEGRGSPRYAGAAGALAGAVLQGLFGVSLDAGELTVKARLVEASGEAHLYQPATDTFVAYGYRYDERARSILMNYRSNHPRAGRLELLLPQGLRPARALLDGRAVSFEVTTVGQDAYAVLRTTWAPHEMQLALRRGAAAAPAPGSPAAAPRP